MIPVAQPDLTGNEEAYTLEAVRSSWISSTGEFINRFEDEFADFCGVDHAIAVSNGTAALHVALMALGCRPGDEVIVPSLTFVSTANAVRYVGAEPVFVDVDPETWTMCPESMEQAITRKTVGIITVDLYGHPCDMDAITNIAGVHGLWVIDDAAEAHGAEYKGRRTGSLADISTFSFFGNKILTCGEGGAVTTNNERLAKRMRTLKGQGVDPGRRYYFAVTGYNFRLTNVACAMLCAQLERADDILAGRRNVFDTYDRYLAEVPGVILQQTAAWAKLAPWLYSIVVDEEAFGFDRDHLAARLKEEGVDTRPFFTPLHRLPPFRRESEARNEHLPVTDRLAASGVNLPTFTPFDATVIEKVADKIAMIQREAS